MSNAHTYKIVKGSDLQYLTALKTLVDHPIGQQFVTMKITYFLHGDKSVALAQADSDEDLRPLLDANAQLFRIIQLTNENRSIQITRHTDHLFDDVIFNPGLDRNPIPPQETVLLLDTDG